MSEKIIIRTNLYRAVLLGIIAVLIIIFTFLLYRNTKTLVLLILVSGVFLHYLLSKKIFQIIIEPGFVTFEYLQLKKRKSVYDINAIEIKKHIDVHFRGGKNEIFFIKDKREDRRIFEINKRSFQSEKDYNVFIQYLFSVAGSL